MQEQDDFGFWTKLDGVALRAKASDEGNRYAVVTEDTIDEIFSQRILAASLYSRVEDKDFAFTAQMILSTLMAVRDELKNRICHDELQRQRRIA